MISPSWSGFGLSDVGRVRSSNQDSFLLRNDVGLFVVADGMGGHAGGDVASRLAVDAFQQALGAVERQTDGPQPKVPMDERYLRARVAEANARILDESRRNAQLQSMGTTLVAMSLVKDPHPMAHIVHVGDSRAYLYRRPDLRQLTQDHSVVEDFVRRGLLTRAQAAVHPRRHALSRAVGIDADVESDYTAESLVAGDLLLLCTDGLTKMMDDDELAALLAALPPHPETICRRLIEESNRRGGQDNVTVICTHFP